MRVKDLILTMKAVPFLGYALGSLYLSTVAKGFSLLIVEPKKRKRVKNKEGKIE